jgi:Domain of unknown function (DUF5667)
VERVPLTVLPRRSREADQLQRALEGRLPRRQLTPAVGGYVEVATRLAEVVPTTPLRPAAEFRAELHGRLLELAVARSATLTAEPGAADRAQSGAETAERHRLAGLIGFAWLAWFTRGWRRTATAATGALLALSVGVGLASASAVPGGLLYPVKELIQSAQVQLAHGDLARGQVLLDQAGGHIGDARTLVSRGAPEPADVNTALRAASGDLGDAQHDLLAHFARTQDPAALTALARFATQQSPQLAQLRGRVPVESEPLVDGLLAQLGSTAAQVRTLTAQCGAPCASVPVGDLPGPDGLLGSASTAAATGGPGGPRLAGNAGSGLGGLLGTGGSGTGSGTTGGLGGASGPVSAGSGGVGVQLPGVGATVPAPGASIGSGGASVTVPPVGATLGPVSASLPGIGVAVPPLVSPSSTHSTAPSASSSSSVCVLVICVG